MVEKLKRSHPRRKESQKRHASAKADTSISKLMIFSTFQMKYLDITISLQRAIRGKQIATITTSMGRISTSLKHPFISSRVLRTLNSRTLPSRIKMRCSRVAHPCPLVTSTKASALWHRLEVNKTHSSSCSRAQTVSRHSSSWPSLCSNNLKCILSPSNKNSMGFHLTERPWFSSKVRMKNAPTHHQARWLAREPPKLMLKAMQSLLSTWGPRRIKTDSASTQSSAISPILLLMNSQLPTLNRR